MSEAYRIKKFHHVTDAKHDRLRDEKLVPLLDKLADKHILNEDFDDLLSSSEAMSLHIEGFDKLEDWLGIIQNMLEGDWLIYYKNPEYPLYLMKFKRYSYQPHKHLYVKHFGELSHVLEVAPSDLPQEILSPLLTAEHLETLPLDAAKVLDDLEADIQCKQMALDKNEKKAVAKKGKAAGPTTYNKVTPQLLVKVRNKVLAEKGLTFKTAGVEGQRKLHNSIRSVFKPGMTYAELVVATLASNPGKNSNTPNPNKVIDKQAWAIFQQLHPGQQPKKGQISEIRKEILKNTNQ